MVPLWCLTSYWCHGILQQKLAKKDGGSIDRQNDIELLWNFYLEYKKRRRVDDMQREQEIMRVSGTFSTEYVFLFGYNCGIICCINNKGRLIFCDLSFGHHILHVVSR